MRSINSFENFKLNNVFFINLTVLVLIGLIAYWVATLNIFLWIIISVIIPSTLLLIHFLIKPLFLDIFTKRKLILIKYSTFLLQNILLLLFFFYLPDAWFSILVIWFFRINIFEIFVDLIGQKEYLLAITTAFCIATLDLHFTKDPIHIVKISSDATFFIIQYTLLFWAWMSTCVKPRFATIVHAMCPLFLPPALWASARTLTGMVALQVAYLPKTNFLINTDEKVVGTFAKVYKPIYLISFVALYIYRYMYL